MFRWPFKKKKPAPAPVGDGKQSERDSEHGVALLLTLAALALLMVLAISFSFQSQTNLQGSQVNADMVRARLLAESALERAMAFLQYNLYDTPGGGTPWTKVWPAREPSFYKWPIAATYQPDWQLAYSFSGNSTKDQAGLDSPTVLDITVTRPGLTPPSFTYNLTPVATSDIKNYSWQPVTDAAGNLTGRLSMVSVDMSGRLDPNQPGQFLSGVPFIDANNDDLLNTATEFYWETRNTAGTGNGLYELSASNNSKRVWFSLRHILTAYARCTSLVGGYKLDLPDEALCVLSTQLPAPHMDIEAFYPLAAYQTAGLSMDSTDLYKNDMWRFTGNVPAGGTTVDHVQGKNGGSLNLTEFTPFWYDGTTSTWKPDAPHAATPPTPGCVPWISKMVADDGTTSVSDQVAANLIDYCDTDSTATCDLASPGVGSVPQWLGNEAVPYINEFSFIFQAIVIPDLADPTKWDVTVTLTPCGLPPNLMDLELVNIYGSDLKVTGVDAQYQIIGSIDYTNMIPPPATSSVNFTVPSALNWKNVPVATTDTYKTASVLPLATTVLPSVTVPAGSSVTVNLTQVRVALRNPVPPRPWVDFSSIVDTTQSHTLTLSIGTPGITFTAEVRDPRSNLVPKRGTTDLWVYKWDDGIGFGSLGAVNTHTGLNTSNPGNPTVPAGYSHDTETGKSDPAQRVSTAYIRNGPPKTLWELGFIDRGEPWRTINLKAYNDGSNSGTYANGDARILEECTPGGSTTGLNPVKADRVNVNSQNRWVWYTLLQNLQVQNPISSPPDPDAATVGLGSLFPPVLPNPNPQLYSVAKAIVAASTASVYKSRGQIANCTQLSAPAFVGQATDAAEEQVIARLAGKLTARENLLWIIATGQAVKDLGSVSTVPDSVEYDNTASKYCTILATQKIMATVYRDAFTNKFKVVRFEYLDE